MFVDIHRDISTKPSVTVWDISSGRPIFDIGSKESSIRRFCLSPDGRTLYSCGEKVLAWDAAKSGPPVREFDAHGQRMISVAVSPDGTMLAAGGLDGMVAIWNIEAAARLGTLTHEGGPVYGLAFSPASRKLVAAGEGGVATIWSIEPSPKKRF